MKLLEDLTDICKLTDDEFSQVVNIFANISKNPEDTNVKISLLYDDDDKNYHSLIDILFFVSNSILSGRDVSKELNELEITVTKLAENNQEAQDSWVRIKESLDELKPYLLYKKEQDLKNRYKRIEHFEVTTDIRPLFNLEKTEIEKNLLLGIIKIKTSDDEDFLCEIYDDKLDMLIDELERAKNKFKILKSKFDI